ncbi:MAG TPA: F0F1 ATP synthase subunit delta [Streptosporangiaceae bacterium]|jgi:F-type H+-transporting ATPase subunit delta
MRGASRASLAAAKDKLATVLAGGPDAGRLGDELFAVTTLLDRQPALLRSLSDPARDAAPKTALARQLLAGKVSDATLGLLASTVGARWSVPGDLSDAAEQLAVLAVVESAESSGQLDDLEDELFRFGRIVNASPQLRTALSNPFAAADRKRTLLEELLAGKVTAATLRLITQAAMHPRGRSLDASLAEYARLAAQRRARLVAEVHVAAGLTDEQRGRLVAALASAYGHDVHLNVVLDPQVVGGISIKTGDELIDGSLAARLAGLRRKLAA